MREARLIPVFAALALVAVAAQALAAQPPPVIRYAITYNSTSLVPMHGDISRLYVRGVLIAYLVASKPPRYTYTYRVIAEKVNLTNFPGNNTVMEEEIVESLAQPRNITIDASRCKVVAPREHSRLDLPFYCNPDALTGLKAANLTVREEDGRIIVDAHTSHGRLHAVYSKTGLLLEARLETEATGEHETLTLRLQGVGVVEAREAASIYARSAVIAVVAAAAAGAATFYALRRHKTR